MHGAKNNVFRSAAPGTRAASLGAAATTWTVHIIDESEIKTMSDYNSDSNSNSANGPEEFAGLKAWSKNGKALLLLASKADTNAEAVVLMAGAGAAETAYFTARNLVKDTEKRAKAQRKLLKALVKEQKATNQLLSDLLSNLVPIPTVTPRRRRGAAKNGASVVHDSE